MQGVFISNDSEKIRYPKKYLFLKNFLFHPLLLGLQGFSLFFIILIMLKFLDFLFSTIDDFTVEIEDLFICGIGFLLRFIIGYMEYFSAKAK